MSSAIVIEVPDGHEVWEHFGPIVSAQTRRKLLEAIGFQVEQQTKRRIHEEKTAPDGSSWPEWSDAYLAASEESQEKAERKAGRKSGGPHHTILELTGSLRDSITFAVGSDAEEVEVGSNLPYAATHQYGDEARHIPKREFLGVSEANARELDRLVVGFIRGLM